MAARGPKRGSAKAKEAAAQAVATRQAKAKPNAVPAAPAAQQAATPEPQAEPLSAAHRENPEKLTGQALKDLGHRRGLSRSAMSTMTDEKIRTELRYLAYAQYETAEA